MTSMLVLSETQHRERVVLNALVQTVSEDFGFMSFASITAVCGLDRRLVRRACRSLARKGLAKYARGLWTENGEPAGAGYAITREGLAQLEGFGIAPIDPDPIDESARQAIEQSGEDNGT